MFDKLYSIHSDEDTDLLTKMFTAVLSLFYFGVQSLCLFGHILIRLGQFAVEVW